MKKWIAMLLTVTMLLGLCSFASAESTTLTVACWDLATTPYYEATKTAYEAAHPDVKIEWVDIASQDYAVKTATMLAGGDTTDIYFAKELSHLQNWASEGFVVKMNDKIAATNYDMTKYAGMDACYKLAGTDDYYALPFRADFWVMYYTKPSSTRLAWPIPPPI